MAKDGNDPEVSRLVVGFLRLVANRTQAVFAEASGVYQADVSRYESGGKTPTERTLRRMAAAAGVPWAVVAHLRRFCRAVLNFRNRSGVHALEDRLDEVILGPALLSITSYRVEDETRHPRSPDDLVREAEQTWEALELFPVDRRRRVAELLPTRCRTWALAVRACDASLKAAADKPTDALELAVLALAVAEQLPPDDSGLDGEGCRSCLQGYCWAHLANAHRVSTDLESSHEAFARAWKLWRAGEPTALGWLSEWRLLSLEASLRRAQRLFPDALALLDRALALSGGEPAAIARCLLKKENVYEAMGDVPAALATLAQAELFVEASKDRHLLFAHRFKTANNLCHFQRFAEAADRLPEIAELAHQQGAELDSLRVDWLTTRVAAGQGRKAEAVSVLERVCQHFTDLTLPYEAALSSLDLAALWLEDGRTTEVRELSVAMAWIFKAKGIQREALASLQLFREAVERDAATVELARRAIAEIEMAKRSGSC